MGGSLYAHMLYAVHYAHRTATATFCCTAAFCRTLCTQQCQEPEDWDLLHQAQAPHACQSAPCSIICSLASECQL
eukprot:11305-Heterococcus_DN1.PRE.2